MVEGESHKRDSASRYFSRTISWVERKHGFWLRSVIHVWLDSVWWRKLKHRKKIEEGLQMKKGRRRFKEDDYKSCCWVHDINRRCDIVSQLPKRWSSASYAEQLPVLSQFTQPSAIISAQTSCKLSCQSCVTSSSVYVVYYSAQARTIWGENKHDSVTHTTTSTTASHRE